MSVEPVDEPLEPAVDEAPPTYTVEDAADDLFDWIAELHAAGYADVWNALGARPVWRLLRVLLLRQYRPPR